MKFTYHTHSNFCDGEKMPEDYILAGIEKGFAAIGFTSHAPVSFETDWTMKPEKLKQYVDNINQLKEKYKKQIQIYCGFETDYYPNCQDYRRHWGIDYTIGSIHFLYDRINDRYMALDGTADEFKQTRDTVFKGNVRALIETYYHLVCDMLRIQTPEIIGHLDVLKKNNIKNCFFNESDLWYQEAVKKTLNVIKEHKVIVEVNTGGISRGYTTEVYPSGWILSLMREMSIPIVLNSDAHHPDWIDAYYSEAKNIIKKAGYTHQRVLLDGFWQNIRL